DDRRGSPTEHLDGVVASGDELPVAGVDGDQGRLVQHDAPPLLVDQGVAGAEVEGKVTAQQAQSPSVAHAAIVVTALPPPPTERVVWRQFTPPSAPKEETYGLTRQGASEPDEIPRVEGQVLGSRARFSGRGPGSRVEGQVLGPRARFRAEGQVVGSRARFSGRAPAVGRVAPDAGGCGREIGRAHD